MIKKFIAFLALSMLSFAAMAGAKTYKSTDGKVFSIDDVRKIEYDGSNGKIILTFSNGQDSGNYLNDNGTVFAKIKADHPEFLTQGTNVLYVPSLARYIVCQSNGTNMGWRNTANQDLNDGCTVYQQSLTKTGNQ